jgi:hypothetical protein
MPKANGVSLRIITLKPTIAGETAVNQPAARPILSSMSSRPSKNTNPQTTVPTMARHNRVNRKLPCEIRIGSDNNSGKPGILSTYRGGS